MTNSTSDLDIKSDKGCKKIMDCVLFEMYCDLNDDAVQYNTKSKKDKTRIYYMNTKNEYNTIKETQESTITLKIYQLTHKKFSRVI